MSDPLVGHVLDGRYEILSKLARGGMATVYRAQDRRLSRVVAVKVMHDGLGDDAEFSRKFDREARSAAVLSNPHVVSVFDQGRDAGRPYIVMEFVEGFTLRHVISREAPLDPLRALDLIEPVVNALASAHEAGIVHRDIKPENVLISDRGHISVADFGLARAVTAQTATATQGMLMGTVSYLPPELVTTGRTDSRGDVYSTGVVLFEMLTGRKPHTGDVPIQVAYLHVHNDIPAPSTQVEPAANRGPIPQYIDALVQACTRRSPAERPRDARQLLGLMRRARQALAAGVTDDPSLTRDMWASVAAAGSRVEPQHSDPDAVTTRVPGPGMHLAEPATRGPMSGPPPTSGQALLGHSPTGQTPRSPDPRQAPGRQSAILPERSTISARTPRTPRTPMSPTTGPLGLRPGSSGVSGASASGRDRRAIRRRRLLVTLVALLLLIMALWFGGRAWSRAQAVSEPNVLGLSQADASAELTANHLTAAFQPEYSETVPKGQVIRTDPAAGASVHKSSTVTAWLSQGPERHAVPTLVGLTQAAATQALTTNALTAGTITQVWSETVPAGTVVAVSQNPGTLLHRGDSVNLDVSRGRRPITIPNQTNQNADAATSTLQNLGFKVVVTTQNSKTVAKGNVISQSPASGTGYRGDTVTLVKSLGPVMVTVPDVRLKSESSATSTLTAAGFTVNVVYTNQAWVRLGIVAAQSPSGGKAAQGSSITLWVS